MTRLRTALLFLVVLTGCSTEGAPVPVALPDAVPASIAPEPTIPTTTTTEAPAPPETTTTTTEPPQATTTTHAHVRTTTTVSAPRTTVGTTPAPRASTGSGACGGSLPPCYVRDRESGGDPTAIGYGQCGDRDCYGIWQIDPRTAESVGFPARLDLEPESVQNDAARAILARDGCAAWSTC